MKTIEVQERLTELGYDPGPIDGILGALTRTAVMEFQKDNDLVVDGIIGRNTIAALLGEEVKEAEEQPDVIETIPLSLPWLIEAARLIGTEEIKGPEHNPVIMDWAEHLSTYYEKDETPWCGLFVGHCVGSQLVSEALPDNILGARNWNNFGQEVTPQFGSILVFWRGSPDGWKGHVGFYWAEDETTYHVLGGNQSDAVNIQRLSKERLISARWPNHVAQTNIIRHATKGGIISTNEE